ncbi:hypothetical protein Aduo_004724 [Ancylostoma duodenale]
MEYEMQMSYTDIITGSISRRFMLSEEYVENNISVINLFMQSMAYERHEQQKQLQTADLLSNIAGSMGLFLGMSTVTLLEIFIYLFKSVWGTVNTERQKQFMEAMLEEENERRQSLVIVEEPQPEKTTNEEEENNQGETSSRKRASRRVSMAPVHIHLDKRGSVALPLFGQQGRSGSAQYNLLPPRKSLAYGATGRRGSTMETAIGGLLPNFQSPRKSIAMALSNRRESAIEGAGEILPLRRSSAAVTSNSYRRPSSVVLTAPGAGRRLSVQQNEDTIHLAVMNRRRSSVHPKNFLI